MVNQFGVETTADADDELLRVVTEFASEQTSSWQAPALIIDNVDRMYPSTLRILNTLAALAVQGRYMLRFILTGSGGLQTLVRSDGMASLVAREPSMHELQPLTSKETMIYLHARMQAAGSERADTIFPFDVCDRLQDQSGGWPGKLNHFALEAIERSDGFPVSVDSTYAPDEASIAPGKIPVLEKTDTVKQLPTRLILTRDGKTLSEHLFNDKKMLIGRSDFADVIVDDDYVSKIHAVLLLFADALVLLDLNSANGTTVNSVRVRKTILKNGDIISLGNHRLKIDRAPAIDADVEKLIKAPDTIRMKNLVDLRRQRARRRMRAAKQRRG
jgi:pSer/pThr/pTyr-binding forkhead associated (FHA) protein